MQNYLSNLEVFTCFTIASLSYLKSMHSVYLEGLTKFVSFKTTPGTIPFIRDIKNYDFAWESMLNYFKKNILIYIAYIITMEVTRTLHFRTEVVSTIFGISFIAYYFGMFVLIITLTNCIAIFFIAKYTKRDEIIWIWTIIKLLLLRLPQTFSILVYHTGDNNLGFNLLMMLSWNVLRCLSFGIDKIHQKNDEHQMGLLKMLSYIFYFPTMVCGPIVNFGNFEWRINLNRKRYTNLVLEVIRCFCIFILIEALQHLFFVADLVYFPSVSYLHVILSVYNYYSIYV